MRRDGYPDELVFRSVACANAAVRDVLAGRADVFTASRSSSRFQSVAARYPLQAHSIPLQATEFAFLNVSRPPFDDVRVRRALDCAIDRRQVARMLAGPRSDATAS